MITNLVINIIYGFVLIIVQVLSVLGTVSISNEIQVGIDYAVQVLSSVDNVIPITVLFAIIILDLAIELAIFTYKTVKWAYSKVPGIN